MSPTAHPKSEAEFPPTLVSLVSAAADRSTPEGLQAFGRLCSLYWNPLYGFLRRQGESSASAQDFVQGFFERLTEQDFLAQMDFHRGRFRTFLRAALWHFVLNEKRAERAERRGGGRPHIPLQELSGSDVDLMQLDGAASPDEIYDRFWAEDMVSRAHAALRQSYVSDGKEAEFNELSGWLAKPSEPGAYAELAARRGVTENAIAAAVKRLRQAYLLRLRAEILPTLANPSDLDAELKYLLGVLLAEPKPPTS